MNTTPLPQGYTEASSVSYQDHSTRRSRVEAAMFTAPGMPTLYFAEATGFNAMPVHRITAHDYDLHLLTAIKHGTCVPQH